jgi:hypothetical protein
MRKPASTPRLHRLRRVAVALAAAACVMPAAASVVMNGTRFVYPFMLAGWRIRGHLQHDTGDIWTRAANYHSRTPMHNRTYRADLIRRADRWSSWLDRYFPTHDAVVDSSSQGKR